jgi:hypothetical protein
MVMGKKVVDAGPSPGMTGTTDRFRSMKFGITPLGADGRLKAGRDVGGACAGPFVRTSCERPFCEGPFVGAFLSALV